LLRVGKPGDLVLTAWSSGEGQLAQFGDWRAEQGHLGPAGPTDGQLQLSTQPEAFGRTAAEALALGRPVLGFDHGGVGEILAQNFPAGRVAVGDSATLLRRAVELLRDPPDVPPYAGASLAQMQAQTLALYAEVRRA
jgi:glycosyltransferase involved in cell wall biosynthesis